jgi:hypothetical protein
MDFGHDTSVLVGGVPCLDLTGNPIADMYRVLVEDAYKTVTCPAGSLFWAPEATVNLLDYINASLSPSEQEQLTRKVQHLFDDDVRMSVGVSLTWPVRGWPVRGMVAKFEITPADGSAPFTATFAWDSAAVLTLTVSRS